MDKTQISVNLLRTYHAWHGQWPALRGPQAAFIDELPIAVGDIEKSLQSGLLRVAYPVIGVPRLTVPLSPGLFMGPMPGEERLRKDTLYIEFGHGNRLVDCAGGPERRLVSVARWVAHDDYMLGGPGWKATAGPVSFEALCRLVRETEATHVEFHVVEEPKRARR